MYYYRIVELEEKLLQMDQEIQQIAQSEPYAEPVGRLRCFRGIDWLVALARVCEIGSYLCTSPTGSAVPDDAQTLRCQETATIN